ncbi:hypothetical protein SAY86_006656 [Trapa natans]|uniref:Uncharacterized protein n=1 Tax=Trapa natans TaxID=22666 RepID=A0AAN7KZ86_TRANT|nr:hypothetical protein SAY86_006656 [Trapa natans]
MDSASQCPNLDSTEENELTPERVLQACDTATGNFSGSCKNENLKPDSESATPAAVKGDSPDLGAGKNSKAEEPVGSPPVANSPVVSSTPTTKGYGLKKWRRIRRDIQKDLTAIADSNKDLKRLSPSPANPTKPFHDSEAMARLRYEGTADDPAALGSNGSSRVADMPTFIAGAASDNSEGWSSKSSTAASVPKFRFELASGSGYSTGKIRIINASGKNTGGLEKGSQQEKVQHERSKKQKGERIKIKKETSHSSGESDTRSSEFVLNVSATSNGKRGDNHDGECSDDAEESKVQFSEEGQNGYSKQNSGLFGDCSQDNSTAGMPWKPKREKHENNCPSIDRDPLVESILSLQSVQESLERELKKYSDIPKEPLLPPLANSINPCDVQLDSQQISHIPQSYMEVQILTMTEKIKDLETKLEEVRASLQEKEAHISELITSLSLSKLPKEEPGTGEFEAGEEVDAHTTADISGRDEVLSFQKQTRKASFYLILQLVLLLTVCLLLASRLFPKPAVPLPT